MSAQCWCCSITIEHILLTSTFSLGYNGLTLQKLLMDTNTQQEQHTEFIVSKINTVLAKVRPYIQSHGGDVRLVAVDGTSATLLVEGTCVGCPLANLTYNKVIKTMLGDEVPEITNFILT
jgi:Fe-S cluster biogenesis protein NfuA